MHERDREPVVTGHGVGVLEAGHEGGTRRLDIPVVRDPRGVGLPGDEVVTDELTRRGVDDERVARQLQRDRVVHVAAVGDGVVRLARGHAGNRGHHESDDGHQHYLHSSS